MDNTNKTKVVEKNISPAEEKANARKRSEEIVSFLLSRYLRERESDKRGPIESV